MKRGPQQARIGYFGKLPAHGDFIRAGGHTALASLLDQWLAEAMTLLTRDPRWKLLYDAMPPLRFAFVGTRSGCAIAGRIAASCDQSRRRFPFLAMSALDVDEPARFVPRSPLVLAALWQRIDSLAGAVGAAAADPAAALLALAAGAAEVDPGGDCHGGAFGAFVDDLTLRGLDAMLDLPGGAGRASQIIMAIGLLLRPVRGNGMARLEKSLVLPLPREASRRALAASFWLHLIAPFLQRADFELALFFADAAAEPAMVVGFCGADPHTLQAIIDPAAAAERHIGFSRLDWVDAHVAASARLRQLAASLAQPQLSLRAALEQFHETFA